MNTLESLTTSKRSLAAVRRSEARAIVEAVAHLAAHERDEDFAVWTHEILARVKDLLHVLTTAQRDLVVQSEGNSCEILRQVRDSLMRFGWKKYREQAVRTAVIRVLYPLVTADEVSGDDADLSMDILLDCGLEPVLEPLDAEHAAEEASG